MTYRLLRLVVLFAALAMILAACGADDDTAPADLAADVITAPPTEEMDDTEEDMEEDMDDTASGEMNELTGLPIVDPFTIEGDIVTAGSSTVFPLSEAIAARFEDEGYGGQITIDSIGSGAGLERFCVAGESDIANASRPIEQEEIDQCNEVGREPIEIRVGTDALVVAVSQSNYFVEDLTLGELATLFSLPRGSTWDQVNPDFPAHPISLFSPGTDSGTFDYFVEVIFEEDEAPLLEADPQLSEDDNVLVQGVVGDGCTEGDLSTACGVSYFGYAYFTENEDTLKALSIEGIEPNAESVLGDYPVARPLFIYTAPSIIAEKPHVAQFIAYYLNNVNDVIGGVGYFPAPDENIQAAATALLDAAGDALGG